MSNFINEAMDEIRKIQKKIQDEDLPNEKRAKLNSLLQEKLRSISDHVDGQRARIKKAFRRPIRRAR